MRLIDADAFAEKLKSLHGHGDYEANIYCAESCYGLGNWVWENPEDYGVEEAEKALKAAPTIDAVPVVRCKKCFYFDITDPCCEACGDVDEFCGTCRYSGECVSFDGYCYHGKVKK